MPFDKPYVEPEDLDVGLDATPEDPELPEQHLVPVSPNSPEDLGQAKTPKIQDEDEAPRRIEDRRPTKASRRHYHE